MVVTSSGYMQIAGKRYAVKMGNFERHSLPVEVPQLQAKRSLSPFIDSETISFDGGIRPNDMDDEANWYYDALGMEPTGPDAATAKQLKIGKQIGNLGTSTSGNHRGMVVFKGNLYVGRANVVQKWTGSAWSDQKTLPAGNVTVLITTWFNSVEYIVAFNDTNGNHSYSSDGTTWVDVTGSTSTGVWSVVSSPPSSGSSTLYIVYDEYAGAGGMATRQTVNDVTTGVVSGGTSLDSKYSRSGMILVGTDAYYASADTTTNGNRSTIYKFSGSTQTAIARVSNNYPVSIEYAGGTIFLGMQNGGELHKLVSNGTTLMRTFSTNDPLSAMHVFQGYLWVACLLTSGFNSRTRIYRYDVSNNAWHQPHAGSSTAVVTGLNTYNQKFVIAVT